DDGRVFRRIAPQEHARTFHIFLLVKSNDFVILLFYELMEPFNSRCFFVIRTNVKDLGNIAILPGG
ncbi:MAG TPA: hypothetical protein VF893_08645, partial [Candidatus Bathyarchaeia archaeon]